MTDEKPTATNKASDKTTRAVGRRLVRWSGTAAQAKQSAAEIIASNNLSEMMRWIITDLWRFTALTEDQLWQQRNTLFANVTNPHAFQKRS